jgi:hypothetical protein
MGRKKDLFFNRKITLRSLRRNMTLRSMKSKVTLTYIEIDSEVRILNGKKMNLR